MLKIFSIYSQLTHLTNIRPVTPTRDGFLFAPESFQDNDTEQPFYIEKFPYNYDRGAYEDGVLDFHNKYTDCKRIIPLVYMDQKLSHPLDLFDSPLFFYSRLKHDGFEVREITYVDAAKPQTLRHRCKISELSKLLGLYPFLKRFNIYNIPTPKSPFRFVNYNMKLKSFQLSSLPFSYLAFLFDSKV